MTYSNFSRLVTIVGLGSRLDRKDLACVPSISASQILLGAVVVRSGGVIFKGEDHPGLACRDVRKKYHLPLTKVCAAGNFWTVVGFHFLGRSYFRLVSVVGVIGAAAGAKPPD